MGNLGKSNLIQVSQFCSYSLGWASEFQFLAYTLRKCEVQTRKAQDTNSFVFGSFGNEPMQSCSVRHVSLLSLASALALASVYSPPSDRFDHRSFISYKYMQLCP